MSNLPPEEVLRAVSADFKMRGVTHEEAAKIMGFNSKQTLSNLLASKKYMSSYQARRFNKGFNYNMDFLTKGEGELQPYNGAHGSTPLGQIAMKYGANTFTLIDGTEEGDIQLIISWIHILLVKQRNEEGLALLAEVYRYVQAPAVIKRKMKGYGGEFYDMEYENQLFKLQCSIIENIDKMLGDIAIRK